MEGHRIFANAPARRPIARPAPQPPPARVTPAAAEPPALDRELLALLTAGPAYGETIDAAYRRKECELAAVFGALGHADARALLRRLSEPRDDDRVAAAFLRLVVDRRSRLLATLARRR